MDLMMFVYFYLLIKRFSFYAFTKILILLMFLLIIMGFYVCNTIINLHIKIIHICYIIYILSINPNYFKYKYKI
jgi:amino acid permease